MNLQNLDMQDIQILSLLQQKLSDEWLPTVLATLRRDLQVWNSLKNPEFRDKVVSKPPGKPASWTPAYFGLLALETDYSPADLRQDPDRTVDERFLAEASSYLSGEFERPASAWGQRSGVPSLSEAAKLALWIRSELQTGAVEAQHFLHRSGRLEIIQTAFACLYDMTGEPFVWLANLMKDAYATEAVDTAIHCLLANPLGPKLQRDSVFGLIRGRPLKDQNAILRRLNARNPEIAADVARKIHSRIQDGARQPARTDIYALTNLFEQAELTTLAQYPDRTADLWREVWEDSRKFQADVSSRLARHMERFKALQEDEAAAVHRWEQASQLHTQRSEHLARYALAVFKAGDAGKA